MSFNTQHTASYYAATARDAAPYPSLDGELSADEYKAYVAAQQAGAGAGGTAAGQGR